MQSFRRVEFGKTSRLGEEVREITAEWLERYNEIRPHDAPGSLPPTRCRERLLAAETPL
jgi:transposase InsO family protein